jgi:DNA gyrase subunit A
MSEIQAKAVLELRLQRLTGMERDNIRDEHAEVMKLITRLNEILANESIRFGIIKDELKEIKEKYGDARKTEITYLADEISMEDLIEEEDVVVTISHLGYIKRTSATEYRQQRRGGRGARGSSTRQEDYIEQLFVASTHHTLLFFTEKGRCFWLKVYEITEGDKQSKGRAIQNLIQIPSDDAVRTIISIKNLQDEEFINNHYIVLCTRKGIIKKTKVADFSRPRQNGINAITIVDGDQLLDACLTDGNQQIMMAVKSGRAIRFPEDKVRPTGRGAIGVSGISVDSEKDEVVGMICVNINDPEVSILVVSAKGYGKRTAVEEYRITNRGGKGVKTINVTEKTGELIGLLNVNEKQDLMITCKSGVTIRTSIASIREAGRATQGVKLIRLDDGDEIAGITNINDNEIEGESDNENLSESLEADIDSQEAEDNGTDNEISDNTENDIENQ